MVDGNEDFKLQATKISNQNIEEAFIDFLHEHYTPEQIHNINETFSYDPEKRTMTWYDGNDIVQVKGDKNGRLKEFRATDAEQTADNSQKQQLSMKDYGQEIQLERENKDADDSKQRLKYILKTEGDNYSEVMKKMTTGKRTMQVPYIGLEYTEKYKLVETSRTMLKNNNYTNKGKTSLSYSGPLGAGIDVNGYSYKLNSDGTTRNHNFSYGSYIDDVMGINGGAYYNSSTIKDNGKHLITTKRQFNINTSAGLESGADVNFQYSRTVTDYAGNQLAHAGAGAQTSYYVGPLYSNAEASLNLESGQQHLYASAGINKDLIMGAGAYSSLDVGNSNTYLKFNEMTRTGPLVGSKSSFSLSAQANPLSLDIKSNNSTNFLTQKSSQSVNFQAGNAKAGMSKNSYGSLLGSTSDTNLYASVDNNGFNFKNHNENNIITSNRETTLDVNNKGDSSKIYYKTDQLTGDIEVGKEVKKESVDEDNNKIETSSSARASVGTGGITGMNYGLMMETENSSRKSDEDGTVLEGTANRKTAGVKPIPNFDNHTQYIPGGIGYKEQNAQVTLDENTGEYTIESENSLAGITTAGKVQTEQTSKTVHRDTLRAYEQMKPENIQTKLDEYIKAYTQSKAGIDGQIDKFQTRPQKMLSNAIRAQHLESLNDRF